MMRKTGESEDEFVVNEADDMNDDGDKDSDSGNVPCLCYFTKMEVKHYYFFIIFVNYCCC